MTTDDMAREAYTLWHENYDLGGPSIEDRCEELYANLTDPEFEAVREAAEALHDAESYRFAFGREPRYDADGRMLAPPGTHVHSTRIKPIFRGESYAETLDNDRRGDW